MKLSTKLNTGFILFLLVPVISASVWLSVSYAKRIEEEARARLAADRKVTQLMLQHELDEFRNLIAAEVNHQGLALLASHKLQPQLERQISRIRQADRLDAADFLSVHEGRQHLYSRVALTDDSVVAGLESIDSELFLTAAAPLHDRNGLQIGVFRIRKTLEHVGLVEAIIRETGADVRLGDEQGILDEEALIESLTLVDIQKTPIAVLTLRHASQDVLLTRKVALSHIVAIGLCALLLTAGLHQYLLRTVIRPIVNVTQATDAIGNGDYSRRVTFSGSDEVVTLATHFNRMVDQIQAAWQQCGQLNEYLENTVEIRTGELRESNNRLRETIEALETTQEQLIAQERLAGLGELSAGIAHEIKNPLNLILQFCQLQFTLLESLDAELAKETPAPQELTYILTNLPKFAGKIEEHARRAVGTISSLLEHSRGSGGIRRAVDLNQLVKEAISLAYHGMRKQNSHVRINLAENYAANLDDRLVPVFPGDLSRALLNIATNACQEVVRKGRSAGAEYSPTVWIVTELEEGTISIRIRDNGDGIAEQDRVKIFQPFFSCKAPGEGTGLGLSIARDIVVKLHQGRLDLDSRPGECTEFLIQFPEKTGEIWKGEPQWAPPTRC